MSGKPEANAPQVFVRTAQKRDLQTIRQLLVETWHHTYDPIIGADRVTEITSDWHSLAALERRLTVPNSEFVVADDGRTILGMAFAYLDGETIRLKQLYVLPETHGGGIGSILFNEILTCFDEAAAIELEVEPENAGAIGFYEKRGFEIIERRESCNDDTSLASFLMRMELR